MTKTHQFDVSEPLPADEMLISTRVGLSRRAQANLSRAKDILTSKEMKDVKTEISFGPGLKSTILPRLHRLTLITSSSVSIPASAISGPEKPLTSVANMFTYAHANEKR